MKVVEKYDFKLVGLGCILVLLTFKSSTNLAHIVAVGDKICITHFAVEWTGERSGTL